MTSIEQHSQGSPPLPPLVVLGGGMAGIAAAACLAERGLRPTLIESRPYLGGRTRSFIHHPTGDEIDNGQHLMMGCYHDTFRLLEMLGTRHLVEMQRSLRVEFRSPDGTPALLDAPRSLPSPLGVLVGMLRLQGLSGRDRLALLRLGLAAMFGNPSAHETVGEYLDRLGQSRELQRRLWEPIIVATLNTPIEQASARLFVEVMRRAFMGRGDNSRLAFPRTGLSRLIEPARHYIEEHGGRVMTGAPVTAIERAEQGLILHLKERPPVNTGHVIAALPWRSLRRLMAGELPGGIRPAPGPEHDYAPIVSLYLWYDRDLPTIPPFAALLGAHVQWMFNRRKLGSPPNHEFPGLLSCTISAAFQQTPMAEKEMLALADRELRGAFPELGDAQLLEGLVVREKHATFLATPDMAERRPEPRTDIRGLYLAGDWTATGLPATIEGAVQSGFGAAAALLNDCGM